jgi:hypothetical protein
VKDKTPIQQIDEAVAGFLADYYGKRDDETLEEAIVRVANEDNPVFKAFRKREGL